MSHQPQGHCLDGSRFLPVFVDQRIESQAILPAGGEVGDIDVGVATAKRYVKS